MEPSTSDKVIGGSAAAALGGVVAVAGVEAGTAAVVVLGGVVVGLPVLVAGVAALGHLVGHGPVESGDGDR